METITGTIPDVITEVISVGETTEMNPIETIGGGPGAVADPWKIQERQRDLPKIDHPVMV